MVAPNMIRVKWTDGGTVRLATPVVTIYGEPGVGKSTLALTADRPAVMDFDGGLHRAMNRRGHPVVQVRNWKEVAGIGEADLEGVGSVVVDTVGSALECLMRQIASESTANHRRDGALSRIGYGLLKSRFAEWVSRLRGTGRVVVLVAHAEEDRREQDEVVLRMLATGSSLQMIYRVSDLLGSLRVAHDGTRVFDCEPSGRQYAKGVGLPPWRVRSPEAEPDRLQQIVADAVAQTNAVADRHDREQAALEALRTQLGTLTTAAEFNALIGTSKGAPSVHKQMLVRAGKERGLEWNRATGQFAEAALPSAPAPAKAAAPPPAEPARRTTLAEHKTQRPRRPAPTRIVGGPR